MPLGRQGSPSSRERRRLPGTSRALDHEEVPIAGQCGDRGPLCRVEAEAAAMPPHDRIVTACVGQQPEQTGDPILDRDHLRRRQCPDVFG